MTTKINKITCIYRRFYNIANNYISESHESSTFESFKAYFYSSNNLFTKKLRKQGMALSAQAVINQIFRIKLFFYINFNKFILMFYLTTNILRICPTFVYCGDNDIYFTSDIQQNAPIFLLKKQNISTIDQVNKTMKGVTDAFTKQYEIFENSSKVHLTTSISPLKAQIICKHLQNPQPINEIHNMMDEQPNKLDPKIIEHSFKDITTAKLPVKNKSAILNNDPITLGRVVHENKRFGVIGTVSVGVIQASEVPERIMETTSPITPNIYQTPIIGVSPQNVSVKFPRRDMMNIDQCCIS